MQNRDSIPTHTFHMHPRAPAAGILVGGRSTRMGFDKAAATLAGIPMAAHVARAASQAAEQLYLVGRTHILNWPADLPVEFLNDASSQPIGPVAGILALLDASQSAALVLGCDIPLIRPQSILALWNFHQQAEAAGAVATLATTTRDGRPCANPSSPSTLPPAHPHSNPSPPQAPHSNASSTTRIARFPIHPSLAHELLNVNDPTALATANATLLKSTSPT